MSSRLFFKIKPFTGIFDVNGHFRIWANIDDAIDIDIIGCYVIRIIAE